MLDFFWMDGVTGSRRVVGLLLVGASGVWVACAGSGFPQSSCTSNVACQDAFGYGSVCGTDGLCAPVVLPERCDWTFPEALTFPVDPAQYVVVGTLFNLDNAGREARALSAQLAFQQVNEELGVEGRALALIHCNTVADARYDGQDEATATVTLATLLADEVGVPALIGPSSSTNTAAVFSAVEPLDVLVISPSATSPSLTSLDGLGPTDVAPGLLWRTAPSDALQGLVIAEDAVLQGHARVGVIYQTGAYGEGLSSAFASQFTALGGDTTLFPFDSASTRDTAVVDAQNPLLDEVLFISSEISDIKSFLIAAAELQGYSGKPIFLTDAAATSELFNGTDSAEALFEQIRGTRPSLPTGQVYDYFAASYATTYGEDVSEYSYTAQSYDAAWMLAYGIAWSFYQEDILTGTSIARGLRRLSDGTPVEVRPLSWNEAKANFKAGLGIDLNGTSGSLDYDPATEETTAPIDVWAIQLETLELETQYTYSDIGTGG